MNIFIYRNLSRLCQIFTRSNKDQFGLQSIVMYIALLKVRIQIENRYRKELDTNYIHTQ